MFAWVTAGLMAPGREAAREDTGLTQAEKLHDEDDDMPQPESSEALTQRSGLRKDHHETRSYWHSIRYARRLSW